jgi:hypothetical protein
LTKSKQNYQHQEYPIEMGDFLQLSSGCVEGFLRRRRMQSQSQSWFQLSMLTAIQTVEKVPVETQR